LIDQLRRRIWNPTATGAAFPVIYIVVRFHPETKSSIVQDEDSTFIAPSGVSSHSDPFSVGIPRHVGIPSKMRHGQSSLVQLDEDFFHDRCPQTASRTIKLGAESSGCQSVRDRDITILNFLSQGVL